MNCDMFFVFMKNSHHLQSTRWCWVRGWRSRCASKSLTRVADLFPRLPQLIDADSASSCTWKVNSTILSTWLQSERPSVSSVIFKRGSSHTDCRGILFLLRDLKDISACFLFFCFHGEVQWLSLLLFLFKIPESQHLSISSESLGLQRRSCGQWAEMILFLVSSNTGDQWSIRVANALRAETDASSCSIKSVAQTMISFTRPTATTADVSLLYRRQTRHKTDLIWNSNRVDTTCSPIRALFHYFVFSSSN